MSKAHLTAIARKKLSTPMRYLKEHSLIEGVALDYGCGRGFDADELGIQGYDPYHRREVEFETGGYDTITCNFVLNVIPEEVVRRTVLLSIRSLLKKGGTAYISVRNDRNNLNGYTSKGTWQGFIELDLPVVKKTSSFIMYKIEA
jgi:2-polyprenyl-3-methyl-5-hydroxy-6-metoxy-1,4-benzoquinol methylase